MLGNFSTANNFYTEYPNSTLFLSKLHIMQAHSEAGGSTVAPNPRARTKTTKLDLIFFFESY